MDPILTTLSRVNYSKMSVVGLLGDIRTAWTERISHELARGEGVRESFNEQLNRLYDLLLQAVDTGDPAWLDPLLAEWATAQTQTDLEIQQTSLTPILSQIIVQSQKVCQELLSPEEAHLVFGALLPMFIYAIENSVQRELNVRIGLIKDELHYTQAKLEQLDRSKSNFISVAAHELKTPLTLLEGYATMLRDIYPGKDQESQPVLLLKGIDNGTRRLREIVDDMIDVSLIDNNLLDLNFQPVWINQLFSILEGELEGSIQDRQQTLTIVDFPGFKDMTFADPERLFQAFRNVLINAVKFTPNGGTITVDGRKLPGFVEVTVSDTGIGIDPEDQGRIFEKFGQLGEVQLHSSGKTKFKGGGPGLGLPITKGIIEAHGGTIWVESEGYDEEKNPGCKFHILLPLLEAPPDDRKSILFGAQSEASKPSVGPAMD
jgi:signal transduction histidine kinase